MKEFLLAHHELFFGAGALWVFSAFASTAPEPDATSGKAYRWFYGFLHALAANIDKLGSALKPPLK